MREAGKIKKPITLVRYKKIFKIVVLMLINLICWSSILITWAWFIIDYLAWKDLRFEYVDELCFYGSEETVRGEAPPYVNGIPALQSGNTGWKRLDGFWFYEIRNQEEWEYFSSILGMEKINQELDFTDYYVISINRKLKRMQCNNMYWDKKEYGSLVRPDFDLDSYDGGKVYIYRLQDKVTFYFNHRDWSTGKYNLDKRNFFLDSLAGDDPYDPSMF